MHLKTTNQKIRGTFDEKCIKYKTKGDEKLKAGQCFENIRPCQCVMINVYDK